MMSSINFYLFNHFFLTGPISGKSSVLLVRVRTAVCAVYVVSLLAAAAHDVCKLRFLPGRRSLYPSSFTIKQLRMDGVTHFS